VFLHVDDPAVQQAIQESCSLVNRLREDCVETRQFVARALAQLDTAHAALRRSPEAVRLVDVKRRG
jgi:arginine deiminase